MGAAVGATAAGMGGYVFGYTSPILTNDCNGVDAFALNCELVLSESVKAVLTSLSLIGGLAGSLLGGPVADRLGRRAGLTVGACCMALGWLLIILCTIGTSRGSSHQAASSLGGGSEGGDGAGAGHAGQHAGRNDAAGGAAAHRRRDGCVHTPLELLACATVSLAKPSPLAQA